MYPNTLTFLFFILLNIQSCISQELIAPDFTATYDFYCIEDTIVNTYYDPKEFVLIADKKKSRFHNSYAQFNDSIVSAWEHNNPASNEPGKDNDLTAFTTHFNKYKKSYAMDFWAEKNHQKNTAKASVLWSIPPYHLEVSYPLAWNLSSSAVDTINGVVCRVATLNYGGHNWKAYYNSDIAISEGPYVFAGLPGLIVRIEDDRGWYRFDLTSYSIKPKGNRFWRAKHYYSYGSQKLTREAYVDRVAEQGKNPDLGPVPSTEAQLLEMKQRFSRYYWRLLEQR